jgi:hypothetical protein
MVGNEGELAQQFQAHQERHQRTTINAPSADGRPQVWVWEYHESTPRRLPIEELREEVRRFLKTASPRTDPSTPHEDGFVEDVLGEALKLFITATEPRRESS